MRLISIDAPNVGYPALNTTRTPHPFDLLNRALMGKKRDIQQVEAIAKEYEMDSQERREFGDYIEDCKRRGEKGSGKDGDFAYEELREKVSEFRGEA